jgi:hypothetical protein
MKFEIATEPLIAGTVTSVSVISAAAIAILSGPENIIVAAIAVLSIAALTYSTVVFIKKPKTK